MFSSPGAQWSVQLRRPLPGLRHRQHGHAQTLRRRAQEARLLSQEVPGGRPRAGQGAQHRPRDRRADDQGEG